MRLLPILFLCLFCAPLLAQQQESRISQILKAKERPYNFQQDKAYRSKGFFKGSRRATDPKPASLPSKFRSKDYLTGAYSGQKGHWAGDFKYETKPARRFSFFQSGKTHKTQKAPTGAFKGQKEAKETVHVAPTRDYRGREARKKEQGHLTPQQAANAYDGNFQEMTIDDVRELLNKNK